MKIQKVTDPAFRKYGQVLEGYDFTGLIKEMKHTPVPEDVIYVPSVEELEALDIMKDLQNINTTLGKTVIVNIHSVELARSFSTRIIALKAGEIVFDGAPEELTDERLIAIYGRKI